MSDEREQAWSTQAQSWTWPALVAVSVVDCALRRAGECAPADGGLLGTWLQVADLLEAPCWATLVVLATVHALSLVWPERPTATLVRVAAIAAAAAAALAGAALVWSPGTLLSESAALLCLILLIPRSFPRMFVLTLPFTLLAVWQLLAHYGVQVTHPGLLQDLLQSAALLALALQLLAGCAHRTLLLVTTAAVLSAGAAYLSPRLAAFVLSVLPIAASSLPAAIPLGLCALVIAALLLAWSRRRQVHAAACLILLLNIGAGLAVAAALRALALVQSERELQSSGPGPLSADSPPFSASSAPSSPF